MGTAVADLDGALEAVAQHHQSGVEELTNIFVDRWQSLYRIALRQLENGADAEDAVQDAFLSAYTHLDQFKRQAQMSTWMTKIVINSARMKLRRRPPKMHVALSNQSQDHDSEWILEMLQDRRPNPEEVSQRNELAEQAVRFTVLISPTLRRTFQLRDVYGLSILDTAKILGLPIGTVKTQTAKARAKLKLLMQNSVGSKRKRIQDFCQSGDNGSVSSHICSNQTRAVSAEKIDRLCHKKR
ncbi:MAG TPA: sigma-70 family RNA polymerase sigma factor [Candidatus Angelobacter sp.]|nr:sigma-70 family RNA polymerase sigma factor [Candidatus Angelobacter sp.]